MKKVLTLLLVATVVASIALTGIGCKTTTAETTAAETSAAATVAALKAGDPVEIPDTTGMKVGKIGFIPYHFANWFWSQVGAETRSVIEAHGGTQIDMDPKGDPKTELDQINSLIGQKVDGIIFTAIDPVALNDAVDAAQKAGIILVSLLDYPTNTEPLTAVVTPSHYNDGYMAGQSCIKALNGKGKIVVFDLPQSKGCLERQRGYDDALKTAPGIEVIAREKWGGTGEPSVPSAQNQMEAWLNKFPEIDGVIAVADDAGVGAVAAIQAAGRQDKIKIFSIDGSPAAIDSMKSNQGGFYSTSLLFPKPTADMGAAIIIRAINNIQAPAKWIQTKSGNFTIEDIKAGKTPDVIYNSLQPFFTVIEQPAG
ncbi:MAG: sugar ABC transporter substrate-binding protein [Actinobacteria bacterium]|nr:sugar ABC transporter substrate-binding protein [Actinomycetota bacterium]